MESLNNIESRTHRLREKYLSPEKRDKVVRLFGAAKNRAILLDYDGTLVEFNTDPLRATADSALHSLLDRLVAIPNTLLFIVSGRDRRFLSENILNKAIGLVAEHGTFIRSPGQTDWQTIDWSGTDWFAKILPIMSRYESRIYGSFIEKKESSLVFHYRGAYGEPELVRERINELFDDLVYFTSNIDVQIIRGSSLLEVRNKGATKGTAALSIISLPIHDFILAIGDDTTDEDLFKVLPGSACTIRVGSGQSAARFYVNDIPECKRLLEALCEQL